MKRRVFPGGTVAALGATVVKSALSVRDVYAGQPIAGTGPERRPPPAGPAPSPLWQDPRVRQIYGRRMDA